MDRICKMCGVLKPIDDLYKRKGRHGKIYHYHQCKDCWGEYHKQHYEENKEQILASCKQYREDSRERVLASRKQYRAKNKEQLVENNKKYYRENRERVLASVKQWKKNNPEKARLISRKYDAMRRNAIGRFNINDIMVLKEKQKGLCFYCGGSLKGDFHVDHFIPLPKG